MWKQTSETTWRADGAGFILYVTKRKPRGLYETYWPTVNIAGRWITLEGCDSLADAQAACEEAVEPVAAA